MRGLATNDTAKRDKTIIVRHAKCHADSRRHFQRARHLYHINAGSNFGGSGLGTGDHVVGNILVVRRNDDQKFHRLVEARQRQSVMAFRSGPFLFLVDRAGAGDGQPIGIEDDDVWRPRIGKQFYFM